MPGCSLSNVDLIGDVVQNQPQRCFVGGLNDLGKVVSLLDQQLYFLREGYWGAFVIPVPSFFLERTENKLCIILRLKLGEPAPFRARYSETGKLVGI
jgi:hypothetical protein